MEPYPGFFVQSLEVEERIDGLLIKESQNSVLLPGCLPGSLLLVLVVDLLLQ